LAGAADAIPSNARGINLNVETLTLLGNLNIAIKEVGDESEKAKTKLEQWKQAIEDAENAMYKTEIAFTTGAEIMKNVTTITNNSFQIYRQLLNAQAGFVDQQVQLYTAQINAIQAQNFYTQSVELQRMAVERWGASSAQAQAAQKGVNLQMALYKQANINVQVAQQQLNFASVTTATNLASLASNALLAGQSIATLTQSIILLRTVSAASAIAGGGGGGFLPPEVTGLAALPDIEGGEEAAGFAGLGLGVAGGLALGLGIPLAIYGGLVLGDALAQYSKTGKVNWWKAAKLQPVSYDVGGTVSQTGLAFVHKGETISRTGGRGGVVVNQTFNISQNVDLNKVRQAAAQSVKNLNSTLRMGMGVY
jgi:hypothetical protein